MGAEEVDVGESPFGPTATKAGGISRRTIITIALTGGAVAVVAVIAAAIGIHVLGKHRPAESSPASTEQSHAQAVRVTSSKLITKAGTSEPKAVVSFYEDFLCPACGNFEGTFNPTVSNLIDTGAIAADYSFVAILDSPRNKDYSSRAGAAAYCVADESIDAFRRFHTVLFSNGIQPAESGPTFPDNARLIELAREAGAAGNVPACVNSGKYVAKVKGMSAAINVQATPTIRINGQNYEPSTPDALVADIKQIVGDVPGVAAL